MNNAENIEKLLKQTKIKTSAETDERILTAAESALKQSTARPAAANQPGPSIWRTIMKTKITKFAAVAVIIIIAFLSMTIFDIGVKEAYAIEQTIEAMRSINSIHAYCTDWDNSKGETWVQINPETGKEEYYYADQGNLLIVGTPQKTFYYYKDKNLVRIRNEYVPASDVRVSRFFEDLVSWVQQYHGELSFNSQFDENLQKEVIMVHGYIPTQGDMGAKEFVFRVDPQTKLPITYEATKCGPGQGVKSVDRIEYNVPIPKGIFEFEIPEGAEVVEQ